MIHDGMPHDPIQGHGQGDGGLKCVKMANFKVYIFQQYACNHQTNGVL